jgi:hypothetical protein
VEDVHLLHHSDDLGKSKVSTPFSIIQHLT